MKRLSFIFCLLSLSISAIAAPLYAPTDGKWNGTSSGTMTIINYDDNGNIKTDTLTADKSGKIEGWKSYISHYSEDPGAVVALEAAKSAAEAHVKIQNLSDNLDSSITEIKIDEKGNLKYRRGNNKSGGDSGWTDAGEFDYRLRSDGTKVWLQIGKSTKGDSPVFTTGDGITITQRDTNGKVKVNYDGSLMNDGNKLSVKANEQAAIYKGSTGVAVLLKEGGISGLKGGLPATGNQVGLEVNVDNATIGISSDNEVEIKGASSNFGKVLQSNGSGVCEWLDAGDGISFENSKISAKPDEVTLKNEDSALTVNFGVGLTDTYSDLSVNYGEGLTLGDSDEIKVFCGDGVYVADDDTLNGYTYTTKLENNEISLYEFNGDTEEKIGVTWGSGLIPDGNSLESFTEDDKAKVRIKGSNANENKILSSTGNGIKWISRGDGIDNGSNDDIKVKAKQNGGIEVTGGNNGGVGVKLNSDSGMQLGDGGLSLQKNVPQPVSGWDGSKWVKIAAGGAEPDGHSIDWTDPGHTNTMQIAGYASRPAGDRVPVARGGGITWLPYKEGITINGVGGTNYVFKAASDTAITFDTQDQGNGVVNISVSVHWQ